jgi:hypothetical protein
MFKDLLEDKETIAALKRVGYFVLCLFLLVVGMKIGVESSSHTIKKRCAESGGFELDKIKFVCQKK